MLIYSLCDKVNCSGVCAADPVLFMIPMQMPLSKSAAHHQKALIQLRRVNQPLSRFLCQQFTFCGLIKQTKGDKV